MTELVRGHRTGPSSIPRNWRGPLPDPSVQHELNTDGGYARIPATLLHLAGVPALGIVTWALLRLGADGQPRETNYRKLARDLRLSDLTDSALEQRIGSAIKPLLGIWIIRKKKERSGRHTYQAVIPPKLGGRYALLRRRDLDMLDLPAYGRRPRMEFSDLVNFGKWQLECGQRGWTANTLRVIAGRWRIGVATASRHRDRLEALGLLEVVKRSDGRLSDLVWLKEAFEPHWELPSRPGDDGNRSTVVGSCSGEQGLAAKSCSECQGRDGELCSIPHHQLVPHRRGLIRNLTNHLTNEDLSNLGGASAPPLTSVPREMRDASPPAPRGERDTADTEYADARQVSAWLINEHPVFANAKPHFRRAVIARLAAEIDRGLAPGHVARALARVVDEGAFDAEMLLVRRALQQARADQLAGMCADCGGGRNGHIRSCPRFVEEWDDTPLENGVSSPAAAPADPLTILLQRPHPDGAELSDDASIVEWLIGELARRVVNASDRESGLRAIVAGLRARAQPQQIELIERAAEHVRYALTRRVAS